MKKLWELIFIKHKLIILLILISNQLYAEDIFFRAVETTPFWSDVNFPRYNNVDSQIQSGNILSGNGGALLYRLGDTVNWVQLQRVYYNDRLVLVYANSLIPFESQDLFENKYLYNNNSEKLLLTSVYVDALISDNIELIYLKNKKVFDITLTEHKKFYFDSEDDTWLTYAIPYNEGCLRITQTSLAFGSSIKGSSHLLVKNITAANYDYILTVKESVLFQDSNMWWNWPNPTKYELFTIMMEIDGDYLDLYLYLDNEKILIDNFIFVSRELFTQAQKLTLGEPNNLNGITWPRRADGTMDYPPPLDMSRYAPTHRVTDNLRLRDSANTSSLIVTTLQKDTEVQIIETGASTTINNITAPWVKVISSTGFTGWCFSGYLEEIAINNFSVEANADTAENSLVRNEDAKALPFWVWIIVGVGVVAVVGIVVILRKRR